MSKKKPKNKKEAQRLKNRELFINFKQFEKLLEPVDIAAPEIKPSAAPPPQPKLEGEDEQPWLGKREMMQRNVGERRKRAKDRWAKSAFASGSGGRTR